MRIRNYMLKFLVSSAYLISIGGESLKLHAMDYNEIHNATKYDWLLSSDLVTKEDVEHIQSKGYVLQKIIGSGHSGFVFLAKDSKGNECAIKFTTNHSGNNDISLYAYNILELNELSEKYRRFFKYDTDDFYYIGSVGDRLLYDKLNKNRIVDLGKNACKILGIEEIGSTNKICVILEYIKGTPLCSYKAVYDTECLKNWLKDICNALKIMYKNNFLHQSIGMGNVLIRDNDNSAVVIDYERVICKELFEKLREIQRFKFDNREKYFDENGKKIKLNRPNAKKDHYDLDCLKKLVYDITIANNYKINDQSLHENILKLDETNTLEEFLEKVDKL